MRAAIDSKDLFKRVNELAKQRGWTLYELSKRAGMTPNAFYNWRDRNSAPSIAMLNHIVEAFGISIHALFTDEPYAMLSPQQIEVIQLFDRFERSQQTSLIDFLKAMLELSEE